MKLPAQTLLLAFLINGCGTTSFDTNFPPGSNPPTSSIPLRGLVRLSPDKPLAGARIRLLDASGKELSSTISGGAGEFAFPSIASGLRTFEIQATSADGTLLSSRDEDSADTFVIVDPLTTLIAEWDRRQPQQTLARSTVEILGFLDVAQAHGGEAANDDSIHSDFDADVIVDRASAEGGLSILVDRLLDKLESDPNAVETFTSNVPILDVDDQILAAMHENLAGPGTTDFTQTVLAQAPGLTPDQVIINPACGFAFNWLAGKFGLNGTSNLTAQIATIVAQLSESLVQINIQLKEILAQVVTGFYDQAAASLNPPETSIETANSNFAKVLRGGEPPTFVELEADKLEGIRQIETLPSALGELDKILSGNTAQPGGLLKDYLAKVNPDNAFMRQDSFDGMSFLVQREHGYQVRGLNLLLERIHQKFGSDIVAEGELAFDRTMLILKQTENRLIKELEFESVGGADKTFTGLTHRERHWATRAIPYEELLGVQAHGIGVAGFRATTTSAIEPAGKLLAVAVSDGFQVGNRIVVDQGDNQETLVVASVTANTITVETGATKHHDPGVDVVCKGASPLGLPNVLYDRDADLIWLLDVANYFNSDLGVKETGVGGWLTPTPGQLTHLVAHVQARGGPRNLNGLKGLGFRGFHDGIYLLGASSRQPFNFADCIFNVADGSSQTEQDPNDPDRRLLRDAGWFNYQPQYYYAAQQILVKEPTFGLSSLEIQATKNDLTTTASGETYPGSSLRLVLNAVCRDKNNASKTLKMTNRATWTVIEGPKIYDPLTAVQGSYDSARLRVSNAPGTEGLLEVRDLPGDNKLTVDEEYLVQAQLGSNIATFPVHVRLAPAKGKPAPLYVSHSIVQNHFVAEGTTALLFKAWGRFRPQKPGGDSQPVKNADPGRDAGADITSDERIIWSVVNDSKQGGPDVTKIATIAPRANPTSNEAQLEIKRDDPLNKIPAGGLLVTIEARWTGTKSPAAGGVVARAVVQVL